MLIIDIDVEVSQEEVLDNLLSISGIIIGNHYWLGVGTITLKRNGTWRSLYCCWICTSIKEKDIVIFQ